MTEATNDNQAINVVYIYDRSNQWQPSYKSINTPAASIDSQAVNIQYIYSREHNQLQAGYKPCLANTLTRNKNIHRYTHCQDWFITRSLAESLSEHTWVQ